VNYGDTLPISLIPISISNCPPGAMVRGLARISHTIRCIGAANQRKSLCCNTFSLIRGAPRCRQSVAEICLDLRPLKAARWHDYGDSALIDAEPNAAQHSAWPVSRAGNSMLQPGRLRARSVASEVGRGLIGSASEDAPAGVRGFRKLIRRSFAEDRGGHKKAGPEGPALV
jgi:hypothetical protein